MTADFRVLIFWTACLLALAVVLCLPVVARVAARLTRGWFGESVEHDYSRVYGDLERARYGRRQR